MRLKKRYEFARQIRNGTTPNPYIETRPANGSRRSCETLCDCFSLWQPTASGRDRVLTGVSRDRESH